MAVSFVVLSAPPAEAAASLSVSPSRGPVGAAFTASFHDQTGPECFGGGHVVTFFWESARLPYATGTMDGGPAPPR